jgi:hypothetical protein
MAAWLTAGPSVRASISLTLTALAAFAPVSGLSVCLSLCRGMSPCLFRAGGAAGGPSSCRLLAAPSTSSSMTRCPSCSTTMTALGRPRLVGAMRLQSWGCELVNGVMLPCACTLGGRRNGQGGLWWGAAAGPPMSFPFQERASFADFGLARQGCVEIAWFGFRVLALGFGKGKPRRTPSHAVMKDGHLVWRASAQNLLCRVAS